PRKGTGLFQQQRTGDGQDLSNGVKVVLKKTDFKADEIRMSAYSFGGTSLYEDKELLNASYITGVTGSGGLGSHNKVELDKLLAGKKVSVSTSVGSLNEFVSGFSSPKDFETLMQLTYLTFTAPHRDEEAFTSFKNRVKAQLESAKANPLSSLNDTASVVLFGNHPRALVVQPEMIDQLDYNRILEMYHERFADADDFRFFFVGNIDMEKAKPLIAQYIGALPSLKSSETFVDRKMEIVKGNVNKEYAKKLQTPMATNLMVYSGACEYNLTNWIKQSALTQILNIIYTEEIREKEGGTYGVSCYANLERTPETSSCCRLSTRPTLPRKSI
ncbi:MAG: M16 family metallopeptidase, partial [Alloprevotella sp.]